MCLRVTNGLMIHEHSQCRVVFMRADRGQRHTRGESRLGSLARIPQRALAS
jgi:hypothetical protein